MFYNNLYNRNRNCSSSTSNPIKVEVSFKGGGVFKTGIKRVFITTSTYDISISQDDLTTYYQIDYIVQVPCVITLPQANVDLLSIFFHIINVCESAPNIQINASLPDHIHHQMYLPPTGGQSIFLPTYAMFRFVCSQTSQNFSWIVI